jgi:hypothetical protein
MRIISLSLLLCNLGWGAFEIEGIDARNSSLGNSASALSVGVSSLFFNPAGLGQIEGPEAYLGYSNAFGLSELSSEAVGVAYNFHKTGIGVGFSNFGEAGFYQEQRISLAGGRKLTDWMGIGGTVNYLILKADGYAKQDAFSFDLGVIGEYREFRYGGVIKNLGEPKLGSDKVLRNYNLGVAYQALPEVSITAGLYYDIDFQEQVELGQEAKLSQNFALRAGFQTEPNRYSLGAGFLWRKLEIDYGFVNHPELGGSHVVGMKIKW